MPWTNPASHIYTTSEVVTAATLNTYVEANLAFLGTPPSCQVYNTTVVTPATATNTVLPFNSERRKTDAGMHSTVTNNSRLTCTVAGNYLITGTVEWAPNATGWRQLFILLDGGTILATVNQMAVTTGSVVTQQSVTCTYPLALTDYVELWVAQTSGGGLVIDNVGNYSPQFALNWIGF